MTVQRIPGAAVDPAAVPTINFGPNAKSYDVTPNSMGVLRELLVAAGEPSCLISSTRRLAVEQARVMYENCEAHDAASQHALYGPCGDQIIDVYEAGKHAGKSRALILVDMAQRIVAIGPYKVSHHAADPAIDHLNVFDIAPSSLQNITRFLTVCRADSRVSKVLAPPADPGVHLEIHEP